jgi:hypothetical protein
MDKLLEWSKAGPDRHFIVRKVGTCIDTHWRVAVWVKPEGEPSGLSGHGSSADLEQAVQDAILRWEVALPDHHRPSAFWYAPRRWCSEFAIEFAETDKEHARFLADLHKDKRFKDSLEEK